VWDGLSRQVRNEIDPRVRNMMERNHMAYLRQKATPYEWQDILANLNILGPQQWLSEKVICRDLMDLWWPLRHESQTGCVYLPFSIVHENSIAIGKRGVDEQGGITHFREGPFHDQYSSVVPRLSHRRIGFVLIRNLGLLQTSHGSWTNATESPNHFFAVLFDYDSRRAYSFGAFGGQSTIVRCQVATESDWGSWYGPELWRCLACQLGWEEASQPSDDINVITKDWEQVGFHAICTFCVLTASVNPEWL